MMKEIGSSRHLRLGRLRHWRPNSPIPVPTAGPTGAPNAGTVEQQDESQTEVPDNETMDSTTTLASKATVTALCAWRDWA